MSAETAPVVEIEPVDVIEFVVIGCEITTLLLPTSMTGPPVAPEICTVPSFALAPPSPERRMTSPPSSAVWPSWPRMMKSVPAPDVYVQAAGVPSAWVTASQSAESSRFVTSAHAKASAATDVYIQPAGQSADVWAPATVYAVEQAGKVTVSVAVPVHVAAASAQVAPVLAGRCIVNAASAPMSTV